MRAQGEARAEAIALVLSDAAVRGYTEDELCDLMFDSLCVCSDMALYTDRDWTGGLFVEICDLRYRDGVRMLDAHESGDRRGLSGEERRCLAYAEAIARKICLQTDDPLGRELRIHDFLCEHIAYANSEGEAYWRYLTTCSGLLDGRGNCQAYSDAFYLLARLAGLDVGFAEGVCEGEDHIWNTIRLDGTFLMVDVTYDDLEFGEAGLSDASHLFFNCAADVLAGDDRIFAPEPLPYPLAETTPEALAYFRGAGGAGIRADSVSGFFRACELCRRKQGARGAEGLVWGVSADPDAVGDAYGYADLGTSPDAWYISEETEAYTWIIADWGEADEEPAR